MQNTTRKILRAWFLTQIVVLCLTLGTVGVLLAKERTEYVSGGTAAVQTVLPVRETLSHMPDMPDRETLRRFSTLLPIPLGNIAAILYSAENIAQYYK